ncbi:RNA polymerase sigma factor (TIGR02999 family) [Pelomonas saccharophila]|uniref:RNA polymerase sigma factor (TIGR02999 family) n=1 Tax=Roseateles saccharophilus TaxID=304 RepID=A0ABU1YGF9_ROSSA|nr:sigma-70 family RNA polymerase sigma factor [Roseateles saccharophilus]MDR7267940.1 RNA polymerase sigma factor (TIGR02999 family) [Roseateles saccharophilus]
MTQLLRQWSDGDGQAFERLIPLVYDDLRHLARRHLRSERSGHTLQSTGLVHEAFLRLSRESEMQWKSRSQLFALVSKLMRHILVDHARARQTGKRGGGEIAVSLEDLHEVAADWDQSIQGSELALDILALDQCLQRLERLDPQQNQVVELRYFGGLSIDETAETLGISAATVKREWVTARAWLLREMAWPAAGVRQHDGFSAVAPA